MEFYPGTFVLCIIETVSVAAESVHMTVRIRNTARAHGDGDLMQCFGKQCPEIPITVRATHICFWIAFNGMV